LVQSGIASKTQNSVWKKRNVQKYWAFLRLPKK